MRFVRPELLLLLLAGCPSTPPPAKVAEPCPPQTVTVEILAGEGVNPDLDGQPRPVVVRLYQLKSDTKLFNASFDDIWQNEKATLADDLIKSEEVQLYPATRSDVTFERKPELHHVAAVALFKNPKGRSWFTSLDLPAIPEAGKCTAAACAEDDDDCQPSTLLAPKLVVWLDGAKVDEGAEHIEDFPKTGPMRRKKKP